MKKIFWATLALTVILSACNNSASTDSKSSSSKKESKDEKAEEKSDTKKVGEQGGKPQILNDISLETEAGVEVSQAFLSYENGDVVPSPNITSLRKPIYLHLNLTKGWKEEMGEVALGASEKISSDNGTVFLDEPDLFQNYKSLNAEDAKIIRLKAVINSMSGPIKYFVVDYKVWDKKGDGAIKGSYKFYVE
jgi:hypothetical protein